ncbi:MAG: hypothetical protein JO247_08005, partial [Chloroflexi bacterium]|nr:hypothetical protein [Chloroflexota bacterium]
MFLLVAGQFFYVTPILEGPDGWEHFKYIRYLLIDHRFPVLDDSDPVLAPYQEAAQYPLYYLLGAAVAAPVSTADFNQVVAVNPHAGDPRGNGNNNFLFHKPFSGVPTGTELAARLVELMSLACGAVTVGCAVTMGWLAGPKGHWLAFGTGAALIADPPFDAFSGYVTNDTLVTALSSVCIALLAGWIIQREPKWSWLAAVAAGLSVLAKFNAIGLAVPYLLAVVLVERTWRGRLAGVGKLALAVGVIDGWWMVRNQVLNGDFSSMLAVNGHTAQRSLDPFSQPLWMSLGRTLPGLPAVLHGLFSTGAYGLDSPPWLYTITTALGVIGLVVGVPAAIAGGRKQPWLWVALAWAAANFGELVVYTLIAGPGARLLFPSVASLALLVALGWRAVLGFLRLPALGGGLGGLGMGVALVVPRAVVVPAYAYPPTLAALPAAVTPVSATFDGAVDLMGASSDMVPFVDPSKPVELTLYWRLRQPVAEPLSVFVHAEANDPDYGIDDLYDGAVGGGTYPTTFWQPGQIVVDHYSFRLKPDDRPDRRNALVLSVRAGMYSDSGKVPSDPPEAADRGVQVALWKLAGVAPSAPSGVPM